MKTEYKGIKVGDRIRFNHLFGEETRYDGREVTVELIDDLGQLHCTWGGLALIVEQDEIEQIL